MTLRRQEGSDEAQYRIKSEESELKYGGTAITTNAKKATCVFSRNMVKFLKTKKRNNSLQWIRYDRLHEKA
jgi:hypothetical protein